MFKINIICTLLIISLFVSAQTPYSCFYGNLHSHTDYSGGVGVPVQAFAYAKDSAHIDILAVTDHLESIYYSSYEWDSIKISANISTINGVFIGMAGFEWTSPTYNHVNVFNTSGMTSPLNVNNWDAFLSDLQNQPNAIAQFNHPGLIGTTNWNSFAYKTAAIDSIFRLIEVKKYSDDPYYQMALNAGWHVSATNNQDNHEWNWGTLDDKRTGIWLSALTYNDIIDAFNARRTFSSEDKNASVWMEFNGHDMGKFAETGTSSSIRIKLNDSNGETWNKVDVVGSNSTMVYTNNFTYSAVDTTILVNTTGLNWIFIRAKQTDGDYLWSAPVFLSANSSVETERKANNQINIFPNPAQNFISVQLKNDISSERYYYLKDITGKIVLSGNSSDKNFNIDISETASGIYFVSIETKTAQYNSKLVILK
jgi:hypothetical protein